MKIENIYRQSDLFYNKDDESDNYFAKNNALLKLFPDGVPKFDPEHKINNTIFRFNGASLKKQEWIPRIWCGLKAIISTIAHFGKDEKTKENWDLFIDGRIVKALYTHSDLPDSDVLQKINLHAQNILAPFSEKQKTDAQKLLDRGQALKIAGLHYFNQKNYQQAFQSFQLSEKRGNLDAALYLAEMYHHGLGVEKSARQAIDWYKKAADQHSDPEAAYKLGKLYFEGADGVPTDHIESDNYFKKSKSIIGLKNINGAYFNRALEKEENAELKERLSVADWNLKTIM